MSTKRTFTVLASDPGSRNYGYAVLRIDAKTTPMTKKSNHMTGLDVRLLEVGKMASNFTTLKDTAAATKELLDFRKELRAIIRRHQPDVQIAERYMSRRMGGATIEYVNQMIGVLRVEAQASQTPIKMMPAAQWKNALKRDSIDLLELYKLAKKNGKRSPHETDAIMIGLYGAFIIMRCKPYQIKSLSKLTTGLVIEMGRMKESS